MSRLFLMPSPRYRRPGLRLAAVCAMHLAVSATPSSQSVAQAQLRGPDVAYASAPPAIVHAMLELAKVTGDDVVYDLGCGDGRIVVAAAKHRGARGVGVDIDPDRIEEATGLALREGVTDRVTFVLDDLFEADFADATVVMLYLQPEPNLRLRPRLLTELRPGTRVVSLSYDMGDWAPDEVRRVDGRRIYLWTIPPRAQPGADR